MERKITECSCATCKFMCKRSPCFPTPSDALKLINAGHKDKLMVTAYLGMGFVMWVVAPMQTNTGCIFHNNDGLCDLHSSGLKPTEGKLAIHDRSDDGLRESICETWATDEGINFMKNHFDDQDAIDNLTTLKQLLGR